MIKTPKLGQTVFFIEGESSIVSGKISQIYNMPSIGIDNYLYMDKKFAFSTKKQAQKYLEVVQEIDNLVAQRNFYEKQIQKFQTKYELLLK